MFPLNSIRPLNLLIPRTHIYSKIINIIFYMTKDPWMMSLNMHI